MTMHPLIRLSELRANLVDLEAAKDAHNQLENGRDGNEDTADRIRVKDYYFSIPGKGVLKEDRMLWHLGLVDGASIVLCESGYLPDSSFLPLFVLHASCLIHTATSSGTSAYFPMFTSYPSLCFFFRISPILLAHFPKSIG